MAVPIFLGDTYQDKRVVGTTPDMFNELTYFGDRTTSLPKGGLRPTSRLLRRRGGATAAKQLKSETG